MTNSKKDILFIMNNLHCGGAEKALLSLLQTFDYSLYNVDLLLFKKEGMFLKQVPKEVNLLDEPKEFQYFDMSFSKALFKAIASLRLDVFFNRILFTIVYKTEKKATVREQKVWNYIKPTLKPLSKKYDLAIGFLEKTPNYFCVDKVDAKVKIGFIHNDYEKLDMDASIDVPFFDKLNFIATISHECLEVLKRTFPKQADKCIIIGNISAPKLINKLALETIEPLYSGLKLITLGRLSPQKGYDLLVETARLLKENTIDFKWYILGIGELQNQLNQLIEKYDLQNHIVFLGLKENPYPYIKQSDIYIQPSRFEGKSVAIDEAKILHKPIIVTNFSTAKDQITHDVNGLIVAMNPEALVNGIVRMQSETDLKKQLIENLSNEIIGNESEIEKIYKIADSIV